MSASDVLFGRRASVLVDTLRVEGLDVKFDITLQEDNLGKATIEIFNLNAEHRRMVAAGRAFAVALSVGYVGHDLTTIFKGSLRLGTSLRQAPDWITRLQSGDGDVVQRARMQGSYPPGTPFEQVWRDATAALEGAGIGLGNALDAFRQGNFKDGITTLLHGGAASGPAIDQVKKLARMANLDVMVQHGELVVTPAGKPLDAEAIVLSPDTGLLGSPERAVDKAKEGGRAYLKVKALILPGLLPKRKVRVRTGLIDGLYVVRKAQYKGDTNGEEWDADLECIPA